jgi:murein DD-endopeptidase MepM/ murein hydrolase activator NlpD
MHKIAAVLLAMSMLPFGPTPTGTAMAAMPDGLLLPLDCQPGQNCWVVRYVDHEPGPETKDYACGGMTGDGHKGTDFAIRDLAAMSAGVSVHAAAGGRVAAVRDGMEDRLIETDEKEAVGGRECGNGVRIDHGDGWASLYCHMRRGSSLVMEGDEVVAGQPIGLVGASGQTSFPHLHFDLRHHDQVVDPFVGQKRTSTCGPDKASLWRQDVLDMIKYRPPLLTNSGITASTPDKKDTRKGWHRERVLPAMSPSLTLWIDGYWFEQGDQVQFLLTGPDRQRVIDRQFDVGQHRQRWFSFASAPRPLGGWPQGSYTGEVRVQRAGSAIRETIASAIEIN